jgi:hypothetical protein
LPLVKGKKRSSSGGRRASDRYFCVIFHERKLSELDSYLQKAKDIAGEGNDVILTGAAPVWLYLKIAHALHGEARKL